MKRLTTLALIAGAIAIPALGQTERTPQFEERVDVNLVLVDAIVTNSKGEQILGLGKGDFIVEEDGVEQEIESVDYYTNRRLVTSPEEKAKFDVARVDEARYFVFFFDKFPGQSPIEGFDQELWRAVRAAKDFVRDELFDQDYVAVVGHDARLEIYTDFTRDRARILDALEQARRFGHGTLEESGDGPSIVASLDETAVQRKSGWVWDGIEMIGEALQPIRGRKVMILFSPGFTSRSGGLPLLENEHYNPMVQALNGANTSVYAVNLLPRADRNLAEANLSRMVEDTGGDYYPRSVNYLTPLRRIENRNNGYYLITYRTNKPEGASGYQKVDVSVKNREFRIEAREGYLY